MPKISIQPNAYRPFATRHAEFCLVVEEGLAAAFDVECEASYRGCSIVIAPAGRLLSDLLRSREVPDDADVLVVATDGRLLDASPADVGAGRTLVAIPSGDAALPLSRELTVRLPLSLEPLLAAGPESPSARLTRLTVKDGLVTDIDGAGLDLGRQEPAANVLLELFAVEPAYRRVARLELGLVQHQGECEGGPGSAMRLILGRGSHTGLDLVLPCIQPEPAETASCDVNRPARRRMNRVRSRGCGCH